jgi:hypothetical protein
MLLIRKKTQGVSIPGAVFQQANLFAQIKNENSAA